MQKLFFILLFSVFGLSSASEIHPYHVGSMEFNYNIKSETFEISGKFFLDDLENALKEKYGKAVHFNSEQYKAQINNYLIKYCDEYLKLRVNNKFLKIEMENTKREEMKQKQENYTYLLGVED